MRTSSVRTIIRIFVARYILFLFVLPSINFSNGRWKVSWSLYPAAEAHETGPWARRDFVYSYCRALGIYFCRAIAKSCTTGSVMKTSGYCCRWWICSTFSGHPSFPESIERCLDLRWYKTFKLLSNAAACRKLSVSVGFPFFWLWCILALVGNCESWLGFIFVSGLSNWDDRSFELTSGRMALEPHPLLFPPFLLAWRRDLKLDMISEWPLDLFHKLIAGEWP